MNAKNVKRLTINYFLIFWFLLGLTIKCCFNWQKFSMIRQREIFLKQMNHMLTLSTVEKNWVMPPYLTTVSLFRHMND